MPICKKCNKEIKPLGWANNCASHRRQEEKRVKNLITGFNALFPVGAKVAWRPATGLDPQAMTVKQAAYNHHGTPVVWFEERTSFCSIEQDFVIYPPSFYRMRFGTITILQIPPFFH